MNVLEQLRFNQASVTLGNAGSTTHPLVAELNAAAVRFDARSDSFAAGKGDICRDMSAKLVRFGDFASPKQAEFARKLIDWSKPRTAEAPAPKESHPLVAELIAAAERFAERADSFAEGKAQTCRDLADKLVRFGSFASDKQAAFAEKLVEWSKPREREQYAAHVTTPIENNDCTDWGRPVLNLFAVMQKHAEFFAPVYDGEGDARTLRGTLRISRRNQDSLCWLAWNDAVVGKLENARAHVWTRKAENAGTTALRVLAVVEEFEADPLETAKKYGRLSGRCCSCGRDLTNEASIEAGIGPICARKFG